MANQQCISAPLCPCGCGDHVAPHWRKKGQWNTWIAGHRQRGPRWDERPYYPITVVNNERVRIHRVRAEAALGRPLPKGAEVHHVDGTKNVTSQLVICQDRAYHRLLHTRSKIIRHGGDPNCDSWCSACKKPKPRTEFYRRKATSGHKKAGTLTTVCRECTRIRNASYGLNGRRSGVCSV